MDSWLVADAAHVVHETLDGEAILIHLGSGTYYSLDGAGAEIWGALAAGVERGRLLSLATERYDHDPVELERSLGALLDELTREGLVLETEPPARPPAPPELPAGRVGFTPLALHAYTDMQAFMLVDPIHGVEAAAWADDRTS